MVQNVSIFKLLPQVHGGTTEAEIIEKIDMAREVARQNSKVSPNMSTVLFFDEANTTEAIGLIKEVMCDGTVQGNDAQMTDGLKIIAACNPYRK